MSNLTEFTVTELAGSIKRTIEDAFGRVRVRGELGRVTIAKSGHCYLDLKDDRAVINSIIWKGTMSRLTMRPEEGMEVVVEGKMSTYPGRSNYQLVIEKMELAGEGALMALLEKRKKALAAEGLFSEERKRDLPFMPRTIGVVTSPTGAVIRDILHRIMDRFPMHVLVWPVLVQGERAAEQIAGAITGFNHAEGFERPDVLIVARGGGSLEDLWCFNEEVVARAAANSKIPLISAVGHETDWTIIDYVADRRAPTPTGAAEIAVPVRDDWLETVSDVGLRLTRGLRRSVRDQGTRLRAAKLPSLSSVLSDFQIRFDRASLPNPSQWIERKQADLDRQRLPSPAQLLERKRAELDRQRMPNLTSYLSTKRARLEGQRLSTTAIERQVRDGSRATDRAFQRLKRAAEARLERDRAKLAKASSLLEAFSYQGVLARGYALVTDEAGQVVRSAKTSANGDAVTLTFADGERGAVMTDGLAPKAKPKPKPKKKPRPTKDTGPQHSLF